MTEIIQRGAEYKIFYPNKSDKNSLEGIAVPLMPVLTDSNEKNLNCEFWEVRFKGDESGNTYHRLIDPSDRVN